MSGDKKGWSLQELAAVCAKAVSSSSAQWTVPAPGYYDIIAVGTSAYALGGTNPTADVSTNYSMIFPESVLIENVLINDAKVALITTGGTGVVLFKRRLRNTV